MEFYNLKYLIGIMENLPEEEKGSIFRIFEKHIGNGVKEVNETYGMRATDYLEGSEEVFEE